MKLYFTLDMKDDPKLVVLCEYWHIPENSRKEISTGIRNAGNTGKEDFSVGETTYDGYLCYG